MKRAWGEEKFKIVQDFNKPKPDETPATASSSVEAIADVSNPDEVPTDEEEPVPAKKKLKISKNLTMAVTVKVEQIHSHLDCIFD